MRAEARTLQQFFWLVFGTAEAVLFQSFLLSHPFAGRKAKGWGMGFFCCYRVVFYSLFPIPCFLYLNSSQEARYFLERALSGGEANALDVSFRQSLQAFQRKREMRAALGGNEGVNLVDDDGFYGAERFRGLRGKNQVERFGGGDEDFRGLAGEAGALALRRVAGADADGRVVKGHAHFAGHVCDADQGRPEVAFDVDCESFERRDVDDATTEPRFTWRDGVTRNQGLAAGLRLEAVQHQTVKAPEEGGESFAGSGGGEDECAFAASDDRPAQPLRGRGRVKDGAEPGGGDGMEAGECVRIGGNAKGGSIRVGAANGHAAVKISAGVQRIQSEDARLSESFCGLTQSNGEGFTVNQ